MAVFTADFTETGSQMWGVSFRLGAMAVPYEIRLRFRSEETCSLPFVNAHSGKHGTRSVVIEFRH